MIFDHRIWKEFGVEGGGGLCGGMEVWGSFFFMEIGFPTLNMLWFAVLMQNIT